MRFEMLKQRWNDIKWWYWNKYVNPDEYKDDKYIDGLEAERE